MDCAKVSFTESQKVKCDSDQEDKKCFGVICAKLV